MYSFCKYTIYFLVKIFYRHKIYGKEHIPPGGAIIASNHCSFLDPPVVGASCPGQLHYLARDTLFRFSPFGWLIRQLNTHPVQKGKGNINTIKMTMELVHSGKKVLIFPEGKRSSDGNLQSGQLGIGMLVQRTRCRVVPVYTHGTFEAWNNQKGIPKLTGHTACIFGSPIEYVEGQAEDKKREQAAIAAEIMRRITELKEWYLAGARGSPP